MIALNDFHDAELTEIAIERQQRIVKLSFLLADGTRCLLNFSGVHGFRCTELIMQNVVYRATIDWQHESVLKDVQSVVRWTYQLSDGSSQVTEDVIARLSDEVRNNRLVLFSIEPSWGAALVVLAEFIERA